MPQPIESADTGLYDKALELINSANEADHSLDQRMGDYEQALEGLRQISGSGLAGQDSTDLTDLIATIERQLERLRLEAFFGDENQARR
jgi:hypothetical protein